MWGKCSSGRWGNVWRGANNRWMRTASKVNKAPGSDGLTSEFYKTFWDDVKNMLLDSINGWQLAKMKKSIPDMYLPWNL